MNFEIDARDLLTESINSLDLVCMSGAAQDLFKARTAEGWRLPTRAELDQMLAAHRSGRCGFQDGAYMSGEPEASHCTNWVLSFNTGEWQEVSTEESHWGLAFVRLVRDRAVERQS